MQNRKVYERTVSKGKVYERRMVSMEKSGDPRLSRPCGLLNDEGNNM